MAKSLKKIRNKKRLGAYLAAGAGSLGMIPAAEAGVVQINITSFGLNGPNAGLSPGYYKQVNNFPVPVSPTLATALYAKNSYFGDTGLSSSSPTNPYKLPIYFAITSATSAASPKKFLSNESVGSDSLFSFDAYFTEFRNSYGVSPNFAANNYMGFRFGSTGNYNYGYLEVTWTSATNTFEIKSAAYESTVNTAIVTPGGGAVPEPASGAIAALLMGGTFLRQWRKKRREETNEAIAS